MCSKLQRSSSDLFCEISTQCYKNTVIIHCLHATSNYDRSISIDFVMGKSLLTKSMFTIMNIHKYTWISPDGNPKNYIDHVLINSRFNNDVWIINTLRGANLNLDPKNHLLVGIWMREKFKNLINEMC